MLRAGAFFLRISALCFACMKKEPFPERKGSSPAENFSVFQLFDFKHLSKDKTGYTLAFHHYDLHMYPTFPSNS